MFEYLKIKLKKFDLCISNIIRKLKNKDTMNNLKKIHISQPNSRPIAYRLDFSALNGINVQCNLNCKYCHHDYFPIHKPFDVNYTWEFIDIIKLLDSVILQKDTPRKIHISGRAEPLIVEPQKMFSEIGKLSKNFPEYEIVMTTNGINLEKYAKELIENGLKRFNVSMHYKVNKNSIIVKGIKKAIQERALITLNVMISRQSIENIENVLDFASEKKLKVKLFYQLEIPEIEMIKGLDLMIKKLSNLTGTKGILNPKKNRLEFKYKNSRIEIKLFEDSSTRPAICNQCTVYSKCREGCWDSIRITPWYIKPCGVREDNVYFLKENSPESLLLKLLSGGKHVEGKLKGVI
jgi:cyclic pyranopterin phosphate synthase